MTVNRGLWVPINTGNIGTTEVEARLADNATYESNDGVNARSGLLQAANITSVVLGTANMSYNLRPLSPIINRVTNEGVYRFSATGTTNVATTAAPAANSRIDIIWVKQNDQSKGDANNLAVAGVTQGDVAASPVAPAIPAGAIELGRATVGPNITATTSASITQTFRHTALRGDPIPVRNTTERAEITVPRPGQRVARLDLDANGRALEIWTGAAWISVRRPVKHVTKDNSVQVGNGSGLPAKILSGEVELIHQFGTGVATTDSSGYLAVTYPEVFPNGVISITVSNGDSGQGRNDVYSVAGSPFAQNATNLYISVTAGATGTGKNSGTVRFNYDVWGW